MSFTEKFKRKIKAWLEKIQLVNSISLHPGSSIEKSVIISGSEVTGIVKIAEASEISKSELNGNIDIGKRVTINGAAIRGNIKIGEGSRIFNGTLLDGNIELGRFTSVNGPNTDLISVVNKIEIGSFCSIARNVSFQEYNHDFTRLTSYFLKRNLEKKSMREDVISKGSIIIGHDVWIGTQCVILSGAIIGTGAVIAANSVVTGDIPPYAIAAGSPAKVIKYRFSEQVISDLIKSEWWNKPKEEIIQLYHNFGKKDA